MIALRRILVVLAFGLLAVFVQGTVMKPLAPTSMIVPNLLLVVVAFLAFYEANILGSILAFVVGLEFDISTGILIGPWAGSSVVVFALLSLISQHVFVESALAIALAVLLSSLLATSIYLTIVSQFERAPALSMSLVAWITVEALLTAILAPLIFKGLTKVMK